MPRNTERLAKRRRDGRRVAPPPAGNDAAAPLALQLGSSEPAEVERAKAEIIARGAAAVPLLLQCLESDGDGRRLRALSLLALLGDSRAAGPVASFLRHAEPAVRARAAGALARIAVPGTIPALARVIHRDEDDGVRLAAARSLVRLVQTGHDEALRPLLQVLADPDDDPRVRTAALEAIPWASPQASDDGEGALRSLLQRLSLDPAPPVAQKARRLLGAPARPRLETWAIERLIRDLRSERLPVWRRALSRLGRAGAGVVEPLCDAMIGEPDDAEFARRTVLVLRGLSGRQLARLGPCFDALEARVPLEALVDVAAGAGSRALLARLGSLIRRLADGPEAAGPGPLDRARQLAHRALARHGSRMAVEDMRRLLEDRRFAVRPELAEAAGLVGTRRDLPAVLRAYRRSRGVARLALREAALAICHREKIRRTDRTLALLEPAERAAAAEILGTPRAATPRRRMGRMERVTSPFLS